MRVAYSKDRLESKLAEALRSRRGQFGADLDCKLLSVDKPKKDTLITCEWRFTGRGYDEKHTRQVRCNNVILRGVPFPIHWDPRLEAETHTLTFALLLCFDVIALRSYIFLQVCFVYV